MKVSEIDTKNWIETVRKYDQLLADSLHLIEVSDLDEILKFSNSLLEDSKLWIGHQRNIHLLALLGFIHTLNVCMEKELNDD